MILKLYARIF